MLPVVRASGQFAVRRTGASTVHLVATAFGPLGGDDATIRLAVEEGARLCVRSVAAAVALPSRSVAELAAELGPAAGLTSAEQVLLGRRGEKPGRWTGTTRVVREGRPLLHTTVDLGPGAPAWLPPVTPRAYASTVHLDAGAHPSQQPVATGEDAVRLSLPGGWTATAWGTELHRVAGALARLTAPERETA